MPDSIPVPTNVGKYTVLRELGRGGMGMVYLAEDAKLRRQVAIKMLLPEAARHAHSRARFLREAQAMAAVRSDNVITIHDVGEENDCPYFVMELLSGYSLDKLIRGGSRLDLDQVIDLGIDFARGIADAHAKGVIHRDIKPANLFVEQPKNRGKVLDFGLTRLRESTELTAESSFMGTLLYMPVEQAKREPVDHRADIYSLGVVLYQLTAGRLPFEGNTEYEVLYALSMTEAVRVERLNPTTPLRFADLIHRMLSKNREDRPQSMDAVVEELDLIRGARSSARFPIVPTAILAPPVTKVDSRGSDPTKGPQAPSDALTAIVPPGEQSAKGWLWIALAVFLIVGGLVVKRFMLDPPREGNSVGANEFVKRAPDEPELLDCTGPNGATPDEVRRSQQMWADYLKLPVETSVDLGDGLKMEFVLIPPGKFWMGATAEEHEAYLESLGDEEKRPEFLGWDLPRHEVVLSRPYYVSKYEVRQREYVQLTGLRNPSRFQFDLKPKAILIDTHPVENVSWEEAFFAAERITNLSLPRGCSGATLLTEAQWEYACRAGTVTAFHFGDGLDGALANCDAKYPFGSPVTRPYIGKTIPVTGSRTSECGTRPNAFGLYQMHGNVMEWCLDGFDAGAYTRHKPVDPMIDGGQGGHVLRGGSWINPARNCRSADRFRNDADAKNPIYGFRVALRIE